MILRRIARPMLATIFVAGGIGALRDPSGSATAAQPGLDQARAVLPDSVTDRIPDSPEALVRINAATQIGGGVLLAAGKAPRLASLILAGTLVPTTVAAHDFWNVDDPATRAMQRTQFFKNVSLLGGLLIAAADTEGKPSMGWRGRRAARHAQKKVAAAWPGHTDRTDALDDGIQAVTERVRALTGDAADLAESARDQGSHLLEVAKDRAPDIADAARERGAELAEVARERSAELLDVARDRGPALADSARARGARWWESARDHGSEWAHLVEERAAQRGREARERAEDALERRHRLHG
ncbi:MAG: DoxX family membrane protein [Rhodococcus sp. (in: high G+C Gram-positive bacteria)]|uniref:DoxX family membrane protein n=1 Tax=Rhodococcus sp. TaxID=1831 RepID=UPI003BB63A67